ncbi:MAG: hypothetical protein D6689_21905 [Deltaproteobacteria bacterium]|nr:MAG: hypothetical protein D6689_21905 [Deltaproteobacteria bacterium]
MTARRPAAWAIAGAVAVVAAARAAIALSPPGAASAARPASPPGAASAARPASLPGAGAASPRAPAPAGSAAAPAPAGPAASPAPARGAGARTFSHAAHVPRGVRIADACDSCHAPDPNGALVPVGARGHQPCLRAGCHAEDFLAAGRSDDRGARAAAFCAGCHAGDRPPPPHRKASADAAFRGYARREFHVDFDHAAHLDRARCTDCHVVDERTFEAVYTPGHPQCAKCHAVGAGAAPPMGVCSACHTEPGRQDAFVAGARKALDLKSCDSAWRADMTPEQRADTPCFRHERVEHRVAADGSRLQCSSCHYMIEARRDRYRTVAQIKRQPIIDGTSMDRYCGARGCHPDVDSTAPGKCERCHHPSIRKKLLSGFTHG